MEGSEEGWVGGGRGWRREGLGEGRVEGRRGLEAVRYGGRYGWRQEGSGDERETGKGGGKEGLGVKERVGEKSSEGRKEGLEEGLEEGGLEEGRTGSRTYWRKERWKKAGIKSLDQMHTYGMVPRDQS